MKISKSLLTIWTPILVIALCLCTLPFLAMATDTLPETEWTLTAGGAENAITADAKYTLSASVSDLTDAIYIGTSETPVNVLIDLNGHDITSTSRAFIVSAGSSLTIKDSVGTGEVQGAETADNQQGGVIRVDSGATLTLESGSIVDTASEQHQSDGGAIAGIGGTVNIAGGTVKGGTAYLGGSIYVTGGALNISGGTIDGGIAANESSIPCGGAVCVKNANFTMTGGTITGGKATSSAKTPAGGNLYLSASGKTFTISGGTIEGGIADNGNGGNIYVANGSLTVSGNTVIENGYAKRDLSRNNGGGNLYLQISTSLTVSGGTIRDGECANSYGGNIFSRGNITMTGGLIEGGKAINGGNIFISGYDSAKTLTISGGTIENGAIQDGTKKDDSTIVAGSIDGTGTYNGENIYANSAVVAVSGGNITDNDGGNAILAFTKLASSPATVKLSLATNDETAAQLDGKIYLVTGAVINTDRGTTVSNENGDQIWRDMEYADAAGMGAMGGTVKGTYNTGNGKETVYEGVTAAEFAAYEEALVEAGYTLYSSNAFNGTSVDGNNTPLTNEFRIYVSDTKVINLNYHCADGRTFVIVENKEDAYLPLTSAPVYETVCDPLITQVGSEDLTLLESPPADFSQENDMCYIMRLADGTFFIIDSAETATAPRIYDVLKKQALDPENIVISGWMITHPHSDHYNGFRAFAAAYADDPTITIRDFIYNFADSANIKEASALAQDNIVNDMKTAFPEAKHNFVHTGNILRYADMELLVLYTQEDFIAANNGIVCNVNGTSLVSRMVFKGGASVFVPADHPTDGYSSGGTWCENKLEIWYGTGLKSDISTTFHHGFNGGAHEQIYYTIAPDIVLWCADYQRIADQSTWDHARNSYFCADSAPKSFAYMARENLTVVNLKDGYPFVDYYAAATAYTGTPAYTEAPEPTEPTEPTEPEVNNFCPHCQKDVEWTEWTGGNITSTSLHGGHHHYRLTKNTVSGSSQIKVGVASTAVFEICIDMNGNQIAKTSRAFAIYGGTTVNLVNTTEKESAVKGAYKAAAAGVINLDGASNLRLYDGVHLYSTAADDVFPYNAGVVQVNSGTFTMLGGKITGRRVLNGGSVYVNTGSFIMEGGTITGGNAVMTKTADMIPEGGNVYIEANGSMTMSGGIIENGSAAFGGNIFVEEGGQLNITGGIVGSSASTDNIYLKGTVNLTLPSSTSETAIALDGQILGEETATITANIGSVETDENGNQIWRNIAPTPETVPGDFTGDEQVNNEDVVALLWNSLFPEDYPLEGNGDLNHDDQVNNEDVVTLLWHSLFPEDYPLR